MSTVSQVASVDWNIVAGAIATFLITAVITWQGLRKGRKNVEAGKSDITPIVGATLMENTTIMMLSEALKECTEELRHNTAELRRSNDLTLMKGQKR